MTPPLRTAPRFILTIACPDRVGIVAAVSTRLAEAGHFITESSHFGDVSTGLFFMRTVFAPQTDGFGQAAFAAGFAGVAETFGMDWALHQAAAQPATVLMVSRFDHCLNDILYRHRIGALGIDVRAIVSNHEDCRWLAERHAIAYFHVPVQADAKPAAERRLIAILDEVGADLVVLARYMQVLSAQLCERLAGRAINIHHSFLPGFKGAKPYHRAFERGVKIIGATAHYVTPDLDEGPIIAQGVEPVTHAQSTEDMIAIGREIEARVLARAVKLHAERRIFLNGRRTVVFD